MVESLANEVGVASACVGMGVARSAYYRHRSGSPPASNKASSARRVARALTRVEQAQVRTVLDSERFADWSPRAVYATLLDEEKYLCHWRTMYRILAVNGEVRERRDQLRHPAYARPELLATRPRELWSWDITKLRGAAKWLYYYLYVILDVFSRYAVGWMVAEHESEALARQLIAETCAKEGIVPGELTLHADRGAAMTALSVAQLLANLGVESSHSRPHVSDDNPYSEAQFKTLKYAPAFPDRFESLAHARSFGQTFFTWYNQEHRHSGLAYLTPAMVHYGEADAVLAVRQRVLATAYAAHPERFVRGQPVVPALPKEVWINKPPDVATQGEAQPAAGGQEPGAEPGSRAGTPTACDVGNQALDAGEHRATIGPPTAGAIRGSGALQ